MKSKRGILMSEDKDWIARSLELMAEIARLNDVLVKLKDQLSQQRRSTLDMVPKKPKLKRSAEHRANLSMKAQSRGKLGVMNALITKAINAGDSERVAQLEAERELLLKKAASEAYNKQLASDYALSRGHVGDKLTEADRAFAALHVANTFYKPTEITLDEARALADALKDDPMLDELKALLGERVGNWGLNIEFSLNPMSDDNEETVYNKNQSTATFRAIQQRAKDAGLL
jgi:hypothetical protein